MRIDPNLTVNPAALEAQKPQVPARTTPQAPGDSAAVVALSPAATQAVSEPERSIASRIEQIRALLERGAYPVDLDVLAARIVDDEQLRAGRSS